MQCQQSSPLLPLKNRGNGDFQLQRMERERGKEQEGSYFLYSNTLKKKHPAQPSDSPPAFSTRKGNFFELQEEQG